MKKILVLDIETSPLIVYTWGTRDQNIGLNQIKHDWFVLSWAAKWLGDRPSKTMYMSQEHMKDKSNDIQLLAGIHRLLDEADIVITQNGQRFDSRKLNARFILNGMTPPSPYKHLDTYQILSRVADFTSNKLEYYTDKLCTKYKKLAHKKYPGMELWKECLAGNKKAWAEMKRYNIHDVLSTEELYLKVRGWTPKTAPSVTMNDHRACVACGRADRMQNRGADVTPTAVWQRVKCNACGKWQRGEKLKVAA